MSNESIPQPMDIHKDLEQVEKDITDIDGNNKKKKAKGPGSIRGIETMFRVSYENSMQLSTLADNKANTLIGINGMIISVIIALVTPRIEEDTWLMAPSLILLLGCLASLALATIASRPRLLKSTITLDQVRKNESSLLFFGNYTQLSPDDFQAGMDDLMSNRRLLYDNMVREIYFMGRVLTRKYYFLRHAYTAFLTTLALSVGVFVVVIYMLGTG